MKKLGVYSLLVAAMLFSEVVVKKKCDLNTDNGASSADSSSNKGLSSNFLEKAKRVTGL